VVGPDGIGEPDETFAVDLVRHQATSTDELAVRLIPEHPQAEAMLVPVIAATLKMFPGRFL
jgi:hypothetical protein